MRASNKHYYIDARALLVKGQVVEVSYNMQAAVDQQYKLVVATHTLNRNDRNAMSGIAIETKENLGLINFTAILDKGYHNGREIETCQKAGITTLVCPPTIVNINEKGTTPAYVVSNFIYNTESDTYTCPAGSTLNTSGSWQKKPENGIVINSRNTVAQIAKLARYSHYAPPRQMDEGK